MTPATTYTIPWVIASAATPNSLPKNCTPAEVTANKISIIREDFSFAIS